MTDNSPLTLQVSGETKAKLERLAGYTHRTHDAVVAKALADYLDQELAIIDAIERGRSEVRAGLGLTSDDVFRDVEAAISEVEVAQAER